MCCPLRDGWKRLPLGSLSQGVDDYHTKAAKGFANAFKESGSARGPASSQVPAQQPFEKGEEWRSSRHSNRRAPRNAKGRKVRSKIR